MKGEGSEPRMDADGHGLGSSGGARASACIGRHPAGWLVEAFLVRLAVEYKHLRFVFTEKQSYCYAPNVGEFSVKNRGYRPEGRVPVIAHRLRRDA